MTFHVNLKSKTLNMEFDLPVSVKSDRIEVDATLEPNLRCFPGMLIEKIFVSGKIFPLANNAITFGFNGIMTEGEDAGKDFHIELGYDPLT